MILASELGIDLGLAQELRINSYPGSFYFRASRVRRAPDVLKASRLRSVHLGFDDSNSLLRASLHR